MGKNRKYYEFMANRKMLWLASVVAISLGLIFNIILGVDVDIRFTGGTMLRYSYPESGIVSSADVPAATIPETISDADIQNTEPEPAGTPVIISGADAPGQTVSDSDKTSSASDVSGSHVSDGLLPPENVTGTDVSPENGMPENTEIPIQPDYSTEVDPAEAGRLISEVLGEEVSVQISTDAVSPTGGDNKRLTVTFGQGQTLDRDADAEIRQVMGRKYPNVALTLRESNSVSSAVGDEFVGKCVMAVTLAVLFMVLYMGFRYRSIGGWTAGVCAITAIFHDCLMAYFAFVIFGFTIDDQFIAVVLAIIGHSINSTIVIFDRIRENRRMLGGDVSVAEISEKSVNETMGRTVSTDLCVFIVMAVLAVVSAVYGIDALLAFALPMMFGVLSGCYSSMCISCTLWGTWQEHIEKRRAAREPDVIFE